jgi:hypothetical protein
MTGRRRGTGRSPGSSGGRAEWLPDTPPADLRRWAVVVLAGIDGLIDHWLTTRDDDSIDAAGGLQSTR